MYSVSCTNNICSGHQTWTSKTSFLCSSFYHDAKKLLKFFTKGVTRQLLEVIAKQAKFVMVTASHIYYIKRVKCFFVLTRRRLQYQPRMEKLWSRMFCSCKWHGAHRQPCSVRNKYINNKERHRGRILARSTTCGEGFVHTLMLCANCTYPQFEVLGANECVGS